VPGCTRALFYRTGRLAPTRENVSQRRIGGTQKNLAQCSSSRGHTPPGALPSVNVCDTPGNLIGTIVGLYRVHLTKVVAFSPRGPARILSVGTPFRREAEAFRWHGLDLLLWVLASGWNAVTFPANGGARGPWSVNPRCSKKRREKSALAAFDPPGTVLRLSRVRVQRLRPPGSRVGWRDRVRSCARRAVLGGTCQRSLAARILLGHPVRDARRDVIQRDEPTAARLGTPSAGRASLPRLSVLFRRPAMRRACRGGQGATLSVGWSGRVTLARPNLVVLGATGPGSRLLSAAALGGHAWLTSMWRLSAWTELHAEFSYSLSPVLSRRG